VDTSETYIKMCDCEEIQGLRKSLLLPSGRENYNPRIRIDKECGYWWESNTTWERARHIWLPRQDQLQGMVGGNPVALESAFHLFLDAYPTNIVQGAESMEQLWLAFVMGEKHNKIWTGEKWEKV